MLSHDALSYNTNEFLLSTHQVHNMETLFKQSTRKKNEFALILFYLRWLLPIFQQQNTRKPLQLCAKDKPQAITKTRAKMINIRQEPSIMLKTLEVPKGQNNPVPY